MKTVAFFNSKSGVGKTSLVYHVAWMMSLLGIRVVVADLDPQAKATSMFLGPEQIESLWDRPEPKTIHGAIRPLFRGLGDLNDTPPLAIAERLHLLVGDLSLSELEDQLSETWPECLCGNERALRVTTAFSRAIRMACRLVDADVALIDVGPNLGAINRSALVAADYVVVPLTADLLAIRGLENAGPRLGLWRRDWSKRREGAPADLDFELSKGDMQPLGYVVSRYSAFTRGPINAFQKWLNLAPGTYRKAIENAPPEESVTIESDRYRLALLKDYRSLLPMAEDAKKPMFLLKPADGAMGGHQSAVVECRRTFRDLAMLLLQRVGITKPLELV